MLLLDAAKSYEVDKRILKFLTEREIEHLRDACFTPIEKALFEFIFSTGCRIEEVVLTEKVNQQLFEAKVIRKEKYISIFFVIFG